MVRHGIVHRIRVARTYTLTDLYFACIAALQDVIKKYVVRAARKMGDVAFARSVGTGDLTILVAVRDICSFPIEHRRRILTAPRFPRDTRAIVMKVIGRTGSRGQVRSAIICRAKARFIC
jgi:hypothetical protein